ncbi:MAG: hypothetical protein DWQ32_16715 [Acidobacteria bacterium]|nr:MAG: hypothetical protein DWQ32_16715 [Acidobacteriota bacterium]
MMRRGRKVRFVSLLGPLVTVLFGILFVPFLFFPGPWNSLAAEGFAESNETREQSRWANFSHSSRAHKAKKCSDCHKFPSANWENVRDESEAFPDVTDYPKHDSCISCHRTQFFSGSKPAICSNCHVNPSPKDSRRHPFANPREAYDRSQKGKSSFSEFAVRFPHEMHVAMMGSNIEGGQGEVTFAKASFRPLVQSETCSMCHQLTVPLGDGDEEYVTPPPKDLGDGFWLKKGTFMSSPIGHQQCFTCHSADSGIEPAPANCGACHQLRPAELETDFDAGAPKRMSIEDKMLVASWRTRDSSATFRHEFFSHMEMDCTSCHTISGIRTADWSANSVNVASCKNCHITATSDDGGILNYEIDSRKENPKFRCTKCHLGYSDLPVPESHTRAIEDLAGN